MRFGLSRAEVERNCGNKGFGRKASFQTDEGFFKLII